MRGERTHNYSFQHKSSTDIPSDSRGPDIPQARSKKSYTASPLYQQGILGRAFAFEKYFGLDLVRSGILLPEHREDRDFGVPVSHSFADESDG